MGAPLITAAEDSHLVISHQFADQIFGVRGLAGSTDIDIADDYNRYLKGSLVKEYIFVKQEIAHGSDPSINLG